MRTFSLVSAVLYCASVAACSAASEDQSANSNGSALGANRGHAAPHNASPGVGHGDAGPDFGASPGFGRGAFHADGGRGDFGPGHGGPFGGEHECDGGFDADGGPRAGFGRGLGAKEGFSHDHDADAGVGPGRPGRADGPGGQGEGRGFGGIRGFGGAGEHCDGGAFDAGVP